MKSPSYNFLSGHWCSTDDIAIGDRTDAWQMALSSSYRDWKVNKRVPADFTAQMRQRDIGGIQLVECICSPCGGSRTSQEIKRDDEPYLGIQITTRGMEHFKLGDQALSFGAGDLVLWVSNQATEFIVTENIHKATLMIPFAYLKERLPRDMSVRGNVVDSKTGMGAILFSHILSMTNQFESLDAMDSVCLKRVTLELVSATLSQKIETTPHGLSQRYLKGIQNYILDHLQEEDLSLGRIAQANRISLRYLHMVFEQTGKSASSWIQEQRLERCGEALLNPVLKGRQVSEIMYQWGFNDASHFSRAFKLHFGSSPKHYRNHQDTHSLPKHQDHNTVASFT